jgi:hypothetical protein
VKRLNALGLIKKCTICIALAIGLSSCGGAFTSQVLQESFWAGGPTSDNSTAELGLAELAKGNYI